MTISTLYEEPLRSVLHKLKYERARAAGKSLGKLLASSVKSIQFDLVSAVPSASGRQRRRGYNPAEEIARTVARDLDTAYLSLLGRLGQQRQVGTRRVQRLTQLKAAFYLPQPTTVKGKSVLLIDDIMTTGATLAECARVLKAAGASRIEAAVVARHHT